MAGTGLVTEVIFLGKRKYVNGTKQCKSSAKEAQNGRAQKGREQGQPIQKRTPRKV